jgi:hypothetical protein
MTLVRAGALLAAVATLLVCRTASAYVRYETQGGIGFFWSQISIPITVYPDDFVQPTMTTDQVVAAAVGAASAWSSEQNPCTYLNLVVSASTDPTPIAAYDNHNTLVFRSTTWCAEAPDGSCETDYDATALAVTSDTANKKTGQIYDSDIEINATPTAPWVWADVESDAGLSGDMDLQNAVTHEMGHLIGLDHTCYDPNSGLPQPYDNLGQPVPACPGSADVQATTMYPSARVGDTQKRTLAPDDQAGLCGIYPVADPPPPPSSEGCASCAVGAAPAGGLSLMGLGLLATLLVRARRARRPSRR